MTEFSFLGEGIIHNMYSKTKWKPPKNTSFNSNVQGQTCMRVSEILNLNSQTVQC